MLGCEIKIAAQFCGRLTDSTRNNNHDWPLYLDHSHDWDSFKIQPVQIDNCPTSERE
jgi:hypothetical protein